MTDSGVNVKLFAGFPLKPPLRHELNKNAAWKISRIGYTNDELIEVHEKNRYYVGIYLNDEKVTFKSLQQTEDQLKKMLLKYLPDALTHDLHIEIFSKLFVL